jgi:hypothetical protein
LAKQTSVEDDAVTTRSNSDDDETQQQHALDKTKTQQPAAAAGHILDSYTKIWESFSKDPSAGGTSLKGSPSLGYQSVINTTTSPTLSSSSYAIPLSI